MPTLRVSLENEERNIPFSPGPSVHDILITTDIDIHSNCGGVGSCGLCLIQIEDGNVNDPTANEQGNLSPDQIRQGIRLACQVKPRQDMRLRIQKPPPLSDWSLLSLADYFPITPPAYANPTDKFSYGTAIDLGTTQIRASLWDMKKGRRRAGCSGLNPQARFGADVLTRLTAVSDSPAHAHEISRLARTAIGEALKEIAGHDIQQIGHVVIVGNTAMLALLAQKNDQLLLNPDYWTSEIDCQPEDITFLRQAWGLAADSRITIAPPLAGFVGSDLLAGVWATRLTEETAVSLLVDFGTNSEIALWDGRILWVTSTAGGPAFEGCGISCGMPAAPGAIYAINLKNDTPEFTCQVIGGGTAQGVCGSGMVDAIAIFTNAGLLNSIGKFTSTVGRERSIPLQKQITLQERDIDVFQRAKAAMGAGIIQLLHQTNLIWQDIERICVCGAFGRFLNIKNAQDIGILPPVPPHKIELCGNTALAGGELLLFARNPVDALAALKKKTQIVNMAQILEFENLFIDNLYLRPMKAD